MSKPKLTLHEVAILYLMRGVAASTEIDTETKHKALKGLINLDMKKSDLSPYQGEIVIDLSWSFTWSETPEGHIFWQKLHEKIGTMPIYGERVP